MKNDCPINDSGAIDDLVADLLIWQESKMCWFLGFVRDEILLRELNLIKSLRNRKIVRILWTLTKNWQRKGGNLDKDKYYLSIY